MPLQLLAEKSWQTIMGQKSYPELISMGFFLIVLFVKKKKKEEERNTQDVHLKTDL